MEITLQNKNYKYSFPDIADLGRRMEAYIVINDVKEELNVWHEKEYCEFLLTTETGAGGRAGIESQTTLGGKQLEGATLLGQGAQTGTTQLGQQTLLSQGNLEGAALQGEQALLQPTATSLASAGQQTLAGQNQLAQMIASTNLDIAKGQENTRNQLALQRGQVEGQLAIKRYGAQMAAQGRASFA